MNVLTILRDLVCQAADLPDDQDSTPEEQAALLAGFEELIARHAHAANVRKVHAIPLVRRTPIDPILSPFEGAWQVIVPGESFYVLNVGANESRELHPGANYTADDPRDALAELVEKGSVFVFPPELHDTTWREALSPTGWGRRAMIASRINDGSALSDCLAHVPYQMKSQVQTRINAIAQQTAANKNRLPTTGAPKRLRATNPK